jgi:hypothetical protein
MLDLQLKHHPEAINIRYTLRCDFTPLFEATLLHICAEFNQVSCAGAVEKHGIDINVKAGIDENGFGGQTPVFYTVNQILNQSVDMLDWLLARSADLHVTVKGLVWGKGYEWETLIPAVNPVSYAMMGLLQQMHRNDMNISRVVPKLLKAAYGIDYISQNVPNKYLKK